MNYKKKFFESFWIFIRGFLMGCADVIPGVSGGTIALITGIYYRLVHAISEINIHFVFDFLRKDYKSMKKNFKRIDLCFFIPLALGIGSAILLLAGLITIFIENYPSYTYAFFFGLILASSYFILNRIRKYQHEQIIGFMLGFIATFLLIGMGVTEKLGHSYPTLFFSGAIAVCAMILPGISGAFILLVIGQYEYMLNVLHNLELLRIITFLIGALAGLLVFSHLLNKLLEKKKDLMLAFLTGLMLGALRLPYSIVVQYHKSFPIEIIIGIAGLLFVVIIEIIFQKKK